MKILQQQFSLSLEDFCITLSEQEIPAHYLVNIELVSGETLADPDAFLANFDSSFARCQPPLSSHAKGSGATATVKNLGNR